MINLRYHIVSITAVFLALGIGVALGSTLIQRATVETLENRLDQQAQRLDRTDGENSVLRAELAARDATAEVLLEQGPALFDGHLQSVPVMVLTVQGTSDETLSEIRGSLRSAGAALSGTLSITARWDELTDDEVAELSDLIDRRFTDPGVTRSLVVRRIAEELLAAAGSDPTPMPEPAPEPPPGDESVATGPGGTTNGAASVTLGEPLQAPPDGEDTPGEDEPEPPRQPAVPDDDLITALISLGYLEFFPDGAATPLPSYGTRYVLAVDEGAVLADDVIALPLLEAMAGGAVAPIVTVSPLEVEPSEDPTEPDVVSTSSIVGAIRNQDRLARSVATVDSMSEFIGHAAMVLALEDLETGRVGHYGRGPGALSLIPERT